MGDVGIDTTEEKKGLKIEKITHVGYSRETEAAILDNIIRERLKANPILKDIYKSMRV